MADVMDMVNWPEYMNSFYRITSNGFVFEVKADIEVGVGLARKPGDLCDYWIVIGHRYNGHYTWIKAMQRDGTSIVGHKGKLCRTTNLINRAHYSRFWLSWKNESIQLGRFGETEPIISYENRNAFYLGYVTFSVGRRGMWAQGNEVHWRLDLPPPLPKPIMKPVADGDMQWVEASYSELPEGALIGGHERETLYIIRAPHFGSLTPGKFVPSQEVGFIGWGGQTHEKNAFEVLCGFNCTWVPTYEDRIPVGAIEGGRTESGEKLFVGRISYNSHLIPGKVQPSHKVCYIPYEDRERGHKHYEILVSPDAEIRSANRHYIDFIDYKSPPGSNEEIDANNVDNNDVVEDLAFE